MIATVRQPAAPPPNAVTAPSVMDWMNDLLWPSIVLTNPANQTLTPGLRLLSGQYEQRWGLMIASCLISMVPPLILYLFAQKYFLEGISVSEGVKG